MPAAPGSPHAVVLPSATETPGEPVAPGERAATLARPFLDPTKYTAVAVVHGMGATAPRAFDLAKQRHARGRGLIWVADLAIVKALTGPDATVLKRLLKKPADGILMTFFSVRNQRVTGRLEWFRLNLLEIDQRYLQAGLN